MNLNDKDWQILGEAPVATFALLGEADGKVSDKEQEAFVQEWIPRIQKIRFSEDPREHEVYRWILQESAERFRAREFDLDRCRRILKRTGALIHEKLEAAEAESIRQALLTLAKEVAESSAGWLGLGDRVSATERAAFSELKRLLRPPGSSEV